MSEKRRDNKGRVLHDNEFQRKDGRYEYRYYDEHSNLCSAYSWRLTSTDRLPNGKRPCEPLREIERRIQDGEMAHAGRSEPTLNDCWNQYIAGRIDLRRITIALYKSSYEKHIRNSIGMCKIRELRYGRIRDHYISLMQDAHLSYARVLYIHNLVHAALEFARRDGLISANPSSDALKDVRRMTGTRANRRRALTEEEQKKLLAFIESDPKSKEWRPLYICLLGTGCRIGEMLALTWGDIDWEENLIHIRRSISYASGRRYIAPPKSASGLRDIPMLTQVREALQEVKKRQEGMKNAFSLDGVTDFVWVNQNGSIPFPARINEMLKEIVTRYNQQCSPEDARLPNFSVHQLRHTFCTRICENETDLKLIQEIMGHSNIRVTMDVYNESNNARKQSSFQHLQETAAIF